MTAASPNEPAPASSIARWSAAFGRLYDALAVLACIIVFVMMMVTCLDVLLRNAPLIASFRGIPGANEVTEYALYFVTMLMAPWLLRRGQHIRIDILLRVIPRELAWWSEWAVDVLALGASLLLTWYGVKVTIASFMLNSMILKSVTIPEWWILAPLPVAFLLLAIEVGFRMHRLAIGPRAPREDAVSSA